MPRTKKTAAAPAAPPTMPSPPSERADRGRLKALASVANKFSQWKPAGQVLTVVRAHPTIFPGVDIATGVGGWPIQRITLVHGPSNHGKTQFVHGLGLSFLRSGNFYAFVDAEYTTPSPWLATLMQGEENNPGFVALRPKSYEETTEAVRGFCDTVSRERAAGNLPEDVCGLIVVDSIKKLVPEKLLAKILKGDDGADGAKGRAQMMKAALNAQWMDELVPLLYHSGMGMVIISRETEAQQEPGSIKLNEPGAGFDYKVGGGKSLIYESSIVARITRSWVKEGTGEESRVVGEKHKVTITKTKVSAKTDKVQEGFFNTSNGLVTPEGFDRARDVFDLAVAAGVLKLTGSWYTWDTVGKWQGATKAVLALQADVGLCDTLEGLVR